MAQVIDLTIYPIKSTTGIKLDQARLELRGFANDRRWAVVASENRRIITAREHGKLLAIRSAITGDGLQVQLPTQTEPLALPKLFSPIERVNLWAEEQHPAMVYNEAINHAFSEYLGLDCVVIYMGEGCDRALPTEMASGYTGRSDDRVSYADDYPILLASQASLDDLNQRLEQPASMTQFRPNIVIDGERAYQEDTWQWLQIGECLFEVAQACPRCVLITVDPATGDKHTQQEPLRTLARYRKTAGGGVPFGIQLVPRKFGTIRHGDQVVVLKQPV
ncbi:MOSC domain-containing protein [Herpetosiphon llansteffanensis]|uniref:MOSC domain-containing protein n=1 Tax=Herpetosiphon llansteffanensis TaxID=2094568 RepID=UPI000D7C3DD1|nr:MOSC N-terminal beta barrel domain-containing protein [Herpetosiphon llansteffanensis]